MCVPESIGEPEINVLPKETFGTFDRRFLAYDMLPHKL